MSEEKKVLRYREFSDGHAMAMDEEGITKEKFKNPEYKCIGGLLATGNMQMEIVAGAQFDKLGKALRFVSEREAESKRKMLDNALPRHIRSSARTEKPKIRSGDTVKSAEGKKYLVMKASVDIGDSGNPRHLVMSLKSQKTYKISEHLLTKL